MITFIKVGLCVLFFSATVVGYLMYKLIEPDVKSKVLQFLSLLPYIALGVSIKLFYNGQYLHDFIITFVVFFTLFIVIYFGDRYLVKNKKSSPALYIISYMILSAVTAALLAIIPM